MTSASDWAYQVKGKLEIPYRYYAGAFCSRFLIARLRLSTTGLPCHGIISPFTFDDLVA